MIKLPATFILLLATVGTAFGASAEFIFFNKLALLILLAIILGGLLTLGGYVIATHLWSKLRRPQPVRVRVEKRESARRPGTRNGYGSASRP